MGISIDKALRTRSKAQAAIDSLYSCARLCGYASDEITKGILSINANMPKGTPHWVRSYIDGYCAAIRNDLYANWLCYGGYIDGIFYSTHSNRDDYYGKHEIDFNRHAGDGTIQGLGHYWKERVQYPGGIYSRETVKPYFIG